MTTIAALAELAQIAHETRNLLRWSVNYSPDVGVSVIAWERNANLNDPSTSHVISQYCYDNIPTCSPAIAVANVRAYLAARFGYESSNCGLT